MHLLQSSLSLFVGGLARSAYPRISEISSLGMVMEQVDTSSLGMVVEQVDWSHYAFMFPTAIGVATCAITAGIGGAALFAPIFLILFPLLGKDYEISSPAAAVATAILTESFGFGSGLFGYYKRGLIDYRMALPFLCVSIPASALAASSIAQLLDPLLLKAIYTALMLGLSAYLLSGGTGKEVSAKDSTKSDSDEGLLHSVVDSAGTRYAYPLEARNKFGASTGLLTAFGGLLTGALGVGIGEVVLPNLLSRTIPLSIAAAPSTLVVALTAWAAAFFQLKELSETTAGGIAAVVPLNLVVFLVPGVIIGGQVASRLQGRVGQDSLEKVIGSLFGAIGLCFGAIVSKSIF